MINFDKDKKQIEDIYPVPKHVDEACQYGNMNTNQKINVIKYVFNLNHGKGKRKKNKRK